MREARLHAAGAGRIRRGHGVPAGGTAARLHCEGILERSCGKRACGAGLARHAGRRRRHRTRGARLAALHRADLHPPRGRHDAGRSSSASCTWSASASRSEIAAVRHEGQGLLLHPVAVVAHHRVQGPAAGAADRAVLQGPVRSGRDERAVPGAPAVLDQHASRPGSWRIRSATSATTARSTRCAAT